MEQSKQKGASSPLEELLNPKSTVSSFHTFMHVLWLKRWRILSLWLLLGLPLALFFLLFNIQRSYEAKAYLRFPRVVGEDEAVLRDVSIREKESIVRLYRSYNVMYRTIRDLGLQFRIRSDHVFRKHVVDSIAGSGYPPGIYTMRFGRDRRLEVYAKPYGHRGEYLVFKGTVPPNETVEFSGVHVRFRRGFAEVSEGFKLEMIFMDMEEALRHYGDNLSVEPLDQGHVAVNYAVALEDRDPWLVAEVVNRLTENFIEAYNGTTESQDTTVLAQLSQSLEIARRKLKESQDRLSEFHRRNPRALAGPGGDGAYSMAGAQARRAELRAYLERLEGTLERRPGPEAADDEKLLWVEEALALLGGQGVARAEAFRRKLASLEERKAVVARNRTPTHPEYAEVERAMTGLVDPVESLALQTRADYRRRLTRLEDDIRSNRGRGGGDLALEMEAQRLVEERELASGMVDKLEMQYERARLAADADFFGVEVVDRARPALYRDPGLAHKLLLAAGAGVAAVFPGLFWVLGLQVVFPRIWNKSDVERKLKAKVLGSLFAMPGGRPKDRRGKDLDPQLLYHGSAYRITDVEAFRALRVEVENYFGAGRDRLNLMVTSTQPHEGKSLVTANLAISFARKGARTLLVDADFRHGRLERMFGLRAQAGLLDLLREGDLPQHEVMAALAARHIQRTPQPNLFLMPKGSLDENSEEAIYGPGMENLLRMLGHSFDVVILDTAPVIVTADPVSLADRVDGVLYVIRSGQPRAAEVGRGLERFQDRDVRVGCVLNDIRRSPADENYYARYGYYYSHIPRPKRPQEARPARQVSGEAGVRRDGSHARSA